jgi:hypothetical protein
LREEPKSSGLKALLQMGRVSGLQPA